jgi:hypothetical protein
MRSLFISQRLDGFFVAVFNFAICLRLVLASGSLQSLLHLLAMQSGIASSGTSLSLSSSRFEFSLIAGQF